MIIVPDTQEKNIPEGIQGRLSYTYLHGRLEDDCGYDCYNLVGFEKFGFEQKDEYSSIIVDVDKTGLYPCTYQETACTLFLWVGNDNTYRGLIVYNDDEIGYRHAKYVYELKKDLI